MPKSVDVGPPQPVREKSSWMLVRSGDAATLSALSSARCMLGTDARASRSSDIVEVTELRVLQPVLAIAGCRVGQNEQMGTRAAGNRPRRVREASRESVGGRKGRKGWEGKATDSKSEHRMFWIWGLDNVRRLDEDEGTGRGREGGDCDPPATSDHVSPSLEPSVEPEDRRIDARSNERGVANAIWGSSGATYVSGTRQIGGISEAGSSTSGAAVSPVGSDCNWPARRCGIARTGEGGGGGNGAVGKSVVAHKLIWGRMCSRKK